MQVGRGDGLVEGLAIVVLLHQRRHHLRHDCITGGRIMAGPFRLDAQGGHDAHVRIEARQETLHITQLVAVHGATHQTGIWPDLEDIIMLDVRVVLLPVRGHVSEMFLVVLPAITA